MEDNADLFLDSMRTVYEALKLGSFERLEMSEHQPGLLAHEVEKISTVFDAGTARVGPAVAHEMEFLNQTLLDFGVVQKNVVVFFVYSSGNPASDCRGLSGVPAAV